MLTIWWCPCVESSLVLLEEGVCYDQHILSKTVLAFALLHFVLQGQICLLLQVSRRRQCTPLQYSCLENPMDGGAWWAAVHGVAKSQTRLSNFTFAFHSHALEKEMKTHSSDLAWRIPGTGEPGGLPSMGSHRVGHDWSNLAAAAAQVSLHFLLLHSSFLQWNWHLFFGC